MNKEALKQFALETGRVIVIALVSYLTTDLVISNLVEMALGNQLTPEMKFQVTTLITVIAKAADRALHETGVADKGLTRF